MYLWVIKCTYCYRLLQNHSGSQATQSREGILFFKTLSERKQSHPRRLCPQLLFLPTPRLVVSLLNKWLYFLIFNIFLLIRRR